MTSGRHAASAGLALAGLAALVAIGCGGQGTQARPDTAPPGAGKEASEMPSGQAGGQGASTSSGVTLPSGLTYEDLTAGTGTEAVAGARAFVHYTGWLTNGTKFDSSLDRGTPYDFVLGKGQVIAGWDEGVAGMKVGGKRRLTVPPDLGYGARGAGGVIPPNATLIFEVELVDLK